MVNGTTSTRSISGRSEHVNEAQIPVPAIHE
jgi:hypothetical protein